MNDHTATIRPIWEGTEAHEMEQTRVWGPIVRLEVVWPEPSEPPADRSQLTERF